MSADKRASQVSRQIDQLSRMLGMILTIKENQPVGIIRLSEITGMPTHKVRYILHLLQEDGVIEPSSNGCVLTGGYGSYISDCLRQLRIAEESIEKIEEMFSGWDQRESYFIRLVRCGAVWLGRGVWRALHPKSSICGGDSRGRPR